MGQTLNEHVITSDPNFGTLLLLPYMEVFGR